MKKIAIEGLILIILFFSIWFLLFQVDWMKVLKVEKVKDKTEQKLGDLFLEIFKNEDIEHINQLIINPIDSLVERICTNNDIKRGNIKFHVFDNDDINAFALPDGHLVIYSGLILAAENQEELCGVLCHEMAHIELNHVMKKLIKEVGLSVLFAMTTGSTGTEMIKETARIFPSSAFDRSLEKAADIQAVKYLIESNIDPESYATFLYKLSDTESKAMKYLSWISTHPEPRERAKYIIEQSDKKVTKTEPVLSQETWDQLKELLSE